MTHPTPLAEKIAAIRKGLHHDCPLALAALDALAKDVAAMEAALEPFAIAADEFSDAYQDFAGVGDRFTLGECRAARAALAAAAKGQGTVTT